MSSEWKTTGLLEHYDVRSGLSKPAKDFGTGFPFLTFKDVFYNYFVPTTLGDLVQSTEKEREGCSVLRGDLFLTRTSETMHELGMSCVALKNYPEATFNGFCKRLRPKAESELVPEYVGYFLRGPKFRQAMLSFSTMSTRASLNNEMIGRLEISYPPKTEQLQIAEILKSLDDRITLLRETNTTLESIAQALFKSWFVDFDPVHANAGTQAPGLPAEIQNLFPSTFVESPLGLVPEGWQIGKLEDLLVLQRGFDLPSTERVVGDYLIIAASGPSGTHEKAMVKGPGVVTGRSGVLGKVFFTLDDYWPLNTTLWIKEFRRASPCFAFEILSRLDLLSFNAGSAVPSLNRNHIHGLPYLLPPRNLVDEFESIAMLARQQIAENNKRIVSISEVRDTLLPRLISGQLCLPETEKLVEEYAHG